MSVVDDQRQMLTAWLARRRPGEPVEIVETHVSFVAFQGDRVWKMKKAVSFPFVDLSTAERRRTMCEREVALNSRFAPDVYLGVVAVADDDGNVVDHAVEMRRMPADRRLSRLAGRGEPVSCVDALAAGLAAAHEAAPRGPAIDAAATAAAVGALWDAEIAGVDTLAGSGLVVHDNATIARLARRYVAGRAPLFDARIAAGRVCDGHGDVLADDVFCLDDGPRVLDCLEFDDHLRWGDALADAAFLAMDLEHLGRPDLAHRFLDRYRDAATDDWPASLEHFYVAYRAHVRAKVSCLRAIQMRAEPPAAAHALFALAHRHLDEARVRIVLVGGPPATGKSTLATALAQATGWKLVRSDVVRKRLAGIEPDVSAAAPVDEGLYAADWTCRTYDVIAEAARSCTEMGESVILDASWADPRRRDDISRVADATTSDVVALQCDVAVDIAAARAASRRGDASDADAAITRALAARFAPWPEALFVDTSGDPADVVRRALAAVGAPLPPE